MTQALYTSKTGLTAGQYQIDVVANNIANINTTAFKAASVNFQTLFSDTITQGSTPTATNGGINPKQIGLGVQVGSIKRNFDSGTFISTGITSDMMISGNGYFAVMDANGNTYLTRDGSFTLDANGDLVNSCTYRVLGAKNIYSTMNSQTNVHVPTVLNTETVATPVSTFSSKDLSDLNNAGITAGTFNIEITLKGVKYHSTIDIETVSCNVAKLVDQINQSLATARVYDANGKDVTTEVGGTGFLHSYIVCEVDDGKINFSITDYANSKANIVIGGEWLTARQFNETINGVISTYFVDDTGDNTVYTVDENNQATAVAGSKMSADRTWTESATTTISSAGEDPETISVGSTTNLRTAYKYTKDTEVYYIDTTANAGSPATYNVYQKLSGNIYTSVGTTTTAPSKTGSANFQRVHTLVMEGSTRDINKGGTLVDNAEVYHDVDGNTYYEKSDIWYEGDTKVGYSEMVPQPTESEISTYIRTKDVTNVGFTSGTSNFLSETGIATNAVNTDFTKTHTVESNIIDYTVNVNDVASLTDAVALEDYTISTNGIIEASYSNGDMLTVQINENDGSFTWKYTTSDNVIVTGSDVHIEDSVAIPANMVIQLATLVNEAGLVSESNNLWSVGPNAGTVFYGVGGSMGLGNIQSSGLEGSNVDMATEFSNMIIAQRAIQANSRVFSTASNVLETLVYMGQ